MHCYFCYLLNTANMFCFFHYNWLSSQKQKKRKMDRKNWYDEKLWKMYLSNVCESCTMYTAQRQSLFWVLKIQVYRALRNKSIKTKVIRKNNDFFEWFLLDLIFCYLEAHWLRFLKSKKALSLYIAHCLVSTNNFMYLYYMRLCYFLYGSSLALVKAITAQELRVFFSYFFLAVRSFIVCRVWRFCSIFFCFLFYSFSFFYFLLILLPCAMRCGK